MAWNESGDKILTGSDDCHLNIYHVGKNQLLHSFRSGHRANIFSAKFLPCTSDAKVSAPLTGGRGSLLLARITKWLSLNTQNVVVSA